MWKEILNSSSEEIEWAMSGRWEGDEWAMSGQWEGDEWEMRGHWVGDERAQEPSSSLRESLIKFLFLLIFSTPPWRAGENTELTSKHPQTAATMSPAPSSSSMARSARRSLSSSATCARSWNPTPPVVSRQAASFRTFFSSTSLTTRPGAHKEQA